jgi:hypothetical protein
LSFTTIARAQPATCLRLHDLVCDAPRCLPSGDLPSAVAGERLGVAASSEDLRNPAQDGTKSH